MDIKNKKLADSVRSLILSNPLFAGLLIQQNFQEDNSHANPTFAVDGETFFYNSGFADSLSFDECKAVCAHEALHLALLHHCRAGNRDLGEWNKATDYAINSELTKQGFRLPKGALLDSRFDGKSAEDIYATLAAEKQAQKQAQQTQGAPNPGQGAQMPANGQGSGSAQPSAGNGPAGQDPDESQDGVPSCGKVRKSAKTAANPQAAEERAKAQIEKAMSVARMAGNLPAGLERTIKAAGSAQYDWREILNRFFQDFTAQDYSFATPNKRFAGSGVILPALRARTIGQITLAIDTSGSVSQDEVSAMVSELQNCIAEYGANGISAGLRVIYCDSAVCGDETLFDGDQAHPAGGGGTLFSPVFRHLENDIGESACLVYLTDGENGSEDLAAVVPSYPVLWGLIRENSTFSPPFGEVFRMDIHA